MRPEFYSVKPQRAELGKLREEKFQSELPSFVGISLCRIPTIIARFTRTN
jgi:hypothetical protein